MLARVCRRAARAAGLDELIVATSVDAEDDAVAAECGRLGVPCFRGSQADVLDRFYRAAQAPGRGRGPHHGRLPAGRSALIDEVVAAMLRVEKVSGTILRQGPTTVPVVPGASQKWFLAPFPFDYASNVLRRTYPRGLDVEIMTAAALERAWREAAAPYERAHVTPYLYGHPERFRLLGVTGPADHSHLRWTVDCAEDLAFVRAVYAALDRDDDFSWQDVLRLVTQRPELAELNRHVAQKQLVEG